jgi:hypothetical protein
VNHKPVFVFVTGVLLMGVSPGFAVAQDIFSTSDYQQDSALWTSGGYYRNNTVLEFLDMQVENRYGETGAGAEDALDLASPHDYANAWEHYQALLAEAGGGTQHTFETLPDWSGRFIGGADRLDGGTNHTGTVAAMLTPEHREYFVQEMKATAEGRIWESSAFCLPGGFINAVDRAEEFVVRPDRVWMIGADNTMNYIRWIYTDGSGHASGDFAHPKWHGESVGFWDEDVLVVHTNQIRGWKGLPFEFTDDLETVERYWLDGDTMRGELFLYDPNVFVRPYFSQLAYERDNDARPELRPLFNSCTDTNGPSSKVFLDERGFLNERLPGDPLYWEATDPRPWGTFFDESDSRYLDYLEAGGTPPGE